MEISPYRRRIAVTGGGTAGHVLPALAFLEAYGAEAGAEGFFIGCSDGMEGRLVPAHSVRLETIPGKPWARQGWFGRIRGLASLVPGTLAARRILRREKVDLVIGTGGYASLGACIAAKTLGVPVVIHESNIGPGLANKLVARLASLIAVGFEETRRAFGPRSVVTGIPVRPVPRTPPETPNFVVLGGSEGSPLLDQEAPRLFRELRRRGLQFTVRHMTGFSDTAVAERAYASAGLDVGSDGAVQVEGFREDMGPVYASATFALAAPGACTLAELSVHGIPSLLVPTPGVADDHQTTNARFYSQRTGALTVPPGPWDIAMLALHIEAVLESSEQTPNVLHGASPSGRPPAVELVRECEQLLQRLSPTSKVS